MKKFTALMILDGFGERNDEKGNAVIQANTPNLDALKAAYPCTFIGASDHELQPCFSFSKREKGMPFFLCADNRIKLPMTECIPFIYFFRSFFNCFT